MSRNNGSVSALFGGRTLAWSQITGKQRKTKREQALDDKLDLSLAERERVRLAEEFHTAATRAKNDLSAVKSVVIEYIRHRIDAAVEKSDKQLVDDCVGANGAEMALWRQLHSGVNDEERKQLELEYKKATKKREGLQKALRDVIDIHRVILAKAKLQDLVEGKQITPSFGGWTMAKIAEIIGETPDIASTVDGANRLLTDAATKYVSEWQKQFEYDKATRLGKTETGTMATEPKKPAATKTDRPKCVVCRGPLFGNFKTACSATCAETLRHSALKSKQPKDQK